MSVRVCFCCKFGYLICRIYFLKSDCNRPSVDSYLNKICRFLWLLFKWIDWHATCLYHLILSGFFHLRDGVTHNYAKEKFRKKTDLFGPKVVFLSLSLHAKYIYMLKSCCCSRLTTRPPVFNPTARKNVGFCIKILPKMFRPKCYRFDLSRFPRIYVLYACVCVIWLFTRECFGIPGKCGQSLPETTTFCLSFSLFAP